MSKDSPPSLLSLEIILGKIAETTLKLQQCQELEGFLQWALTDTRTLLQTDRVLLYHCLKDQMAVITLESVGAECTPLLGQQFDAACFDATWVARYQQGQTTPFADRHDGMLVPVPVQWLEQVQVQAHLAVPLVSQGKLWGFLMAHHCCRPHEWQPLEEQYLQQIALLLGLAMQQRDLQACGTADQAAVPSQPLPAAICLPEPDADRAFVEHAPDLIERFDTHLRHLYVSPTLTRLTGLPAAAFLGKTCRELGLPEAMVHTWETAAQRVLATGEKQIIEFETPTLDGDRWFEMAIVPEWTPDRVLQSLLCFSRDITDRKAAETMLRQYERIVSATPDCVALVDRHYIYQVINQTYEVWNAKPAKVIVGHSVSALLGETLFQTIKPHLDRCFAGATEHLEAWIDYRGVGRRFVRATYAPYRALDDTITGAVIHVHDLTDLKRVEEALAQSEERFRQMAASIHEVFWIAPLDLTEMLYVSPAYETIWGRSCASLYQQPTSFLDSIHPADRAQVVAHIAQHRHSGFSHEYRTIHPDGTIRWIWERATPVPDQTGQTYRLAGISQDITERKAHELALRQQTQREQALNRVLQAIRHSLDLDTIFATATAETAQLLQAERVQVAQYFPERRCWQIVAAYHPAGLTATVGLEILGVENLLSDQLKRGEVVRLVNTDTLTDAQNQPSSQTQQGAWLLLPLMHQGNVWGSLTINAPSQAWTWSEEQVALVQAVADQLAIAIQQANLYRQTQLELVERQRAEVALHQLNQALEQRVQERTEALQKQAEQERLLQLVTQRIHASFNLEDIWETALTASRQTLLADRVAIYCFHSDWSGEFVAESVNPGWIPLVGPEMQTVWEDTHLQQTQGGRYQQGDTFAVHDIATVGHTQCHLDLLAQIQARAYAIAPIFVHDRLWGLLAAYQNAAPRLWQSEEVELLRQIALRVAIAIQQSTLYQTAQTQVQELERLNQVKDDFLSTVSHELRSPMTNIKMATQMLEIQLTRTGLMDSAGTSPISRYFQILKEQSEREIQLINDLLDLARLDASTEPLTLTNLCLRLWVEQLAGTFSERTQQQQQQLQLEIPSHLALETDVSYLERILAELLHNACKYTPAGETIWISACQIEGVNDPITSVRSQQTQPLIQLRVSNTGVEIPPAECERIFDKFYRIPKNDPWKHGGTGLGLALVKKLTERLGGSIHVISGDGQTTFVLTFGSGNIAADASYP